MIKDKGQVRKGTMIKTMECIGIRREEKRFGRIRERER